MEPWYGELGDVASSRGITGVVNIDTLDAIYSVLPVARATQRALQGGSAPMWDHGSLTGFPLGAFSPLYPFQLLGYAILPPETALNVLTIFHLLLTAFFAFLLTRELSGCDISAVVSGLVASLNSIVVFYLISPGMLLAIAWVLPPVYFLLRFRREPRAVWTLCAGIGYGLLLLTANPQLALYTSMAFGALVVVLVGVEWRRRELRRGLLLLAHSAGMVVVGVAVGLPSLVMVLSAAEGAERAPQVRVFTQWGHWIRLVVPYFWGSPTYPVPGVGQNTRVYIGVLPLVAAGLGTLRSRRAEAVVFVVVSVVFGAITLGVPALSTVFWRAMPEVYLDHSRLLIVASLLLAVCAGLGVGQLLSDARLRRWTAACLGVTCVGVGAILAGLGLVSSLGGGTHLGVIRAGAARQALAVAAVALLAVVAVGRAPARLRGAVLIAAVAFDLLLVQAPFIGVFPRGLVAPPPTIARLSDRLETAGVPRPRVVCFDGDTFGPKPQTLNLFDIPQVTGYSSLPSRRLNRLTFASGARENEDWFWVMLFEASRPTAPLFDALGAEFVLVALPEVVEPDERVRLVPGVEPGMVRLRRYEVPTLPHAALREPLATRVPPGGRSFLLTGLVVLGGGVDYEVVVAGRVAAAGRVELTSDIPFWEALAVDLTGHAGTVTEVELRARPVQGGAWRWVDPQLHFNPDGSALQLVDAGGVLVYRNTRAFPRAWMVGEIVLVPPGDVDRAVEATLSPAVDLGRTAVVECETSLQLAGRPLDGTVEWVQHRPTLVEMQVSTGGDGLLVVSDLFHPGWRASLDGVPTRIYATNAAMRGVVVPSGEHTVRFEYRPGGLGAAVGTSAVALASCMAAVAVAVSRRRREAS